MIEYCQPSARSKMSGINPVGQARAPSPTLPRKREREQESRSITRIEAIIHGRVLRPAEASGNLWGQCHARLCSCGPSGRTGVMTERERIVLSSEDCDVFYSALIDPPQPNEKLEAAARRYRERFGG
jgi:hypothetical protein